MLSEIANFSKNLLLLTDKQAEPAPHVKLPNLSQKNYNIYDKLLLAITLTIASGGLVYYIYALNWLGVIIALAITIIAFLKAQKYFLDSVKVELSIDRTNLALIAIYIILYAATIYSLFSVASDRSLISPWQVVRPHFFWLYLALAAISILSLIREKLGRTWKLLMVSSFYFLSFSVAAIIYKIGYGFDPFIHQATMELINSQGFVLPKTPYYSGQYGLIIILHKISRLPIGLLNTFLVPALAAGLLPTALYRFLNSQSLLDEAPNRKTSQSALITILFALLISFSPFIITTPQNLSYLFLILTLLSSLSHRPWPRTTLLAIATAALHPLTGLPALAWAALIIINKPENKIKPEAKKYLKWLVWLFSALALPLALFLASGHSYKKGAAALSSFYEALKSLIGSPATAGREDWLSNLTYFFSSNYQALLIALVLLTIYYFRRERKKLGDLALMFSALAIAYFLSGLINFSDLINYEQADYAKRIPILMLIFSLPLIMILGEELITRISQQKLSNRLIWISIGLAALAASLYLSYPRFDKYWNSRGYSTSLNDIKAVRLISEKSTKPYLVLANQQVSAAALKEFGFDHYFSTAIGPVYFYPIPTGGPLYQYYLEMVYKSPSRESMEKALRLAGAEEGYLVVNKYWYQSDRAINEAKLRADEWWAINNEVYIFLYGRQK